METVQNYQPFNMTERDFDSMQNSNQLDLNETVEIKTKGRPIGASNHKSKSGSIHQRPVKNNFSPNRSQKQSLMG